jgi:hypothetical protein
VAVVYIAVAARRPQTAPSLSGQLEEELRLRIVSSPEKNAG